jgi:predicted DsbA family dithiol-disulfide isomerase
VVIGPSGKTYAINGALPQAAIEQIIEQALKEG